MNTQKLVISSACAAIVSIAFVVVVTIWAEMSAPLKSWLAGLSGHHWTSKSILSVAIYAGGMLLLYVSPHGLNDVRLKKMLFFLLLSAAIGTVALAAFYTGHFMRVF